MEQRQRDFLLKEFAAKVVNFEDDVDGQGELGPETVRLITDYDLAIAWLRGGGATGPGVSKFLEGRLQAFDREMNHEAIAYEHDAFAAAIEASKEERPA